MLAQLRDEGPRTPEVSFRQAMELLDLAPNEDPFREEDAAKARAIWLKLRVWAASHVRR